MDEHHDLQNHYFITVKPTSINDELVLPVDDTVPNIQVSRKNLGCCDKSQMSYPLVN